MPRLVSVQRTAADLDSSKPLFGIEVQLWAAADALRGSIDAAEYKHVVLGLLFLKYISDAFEEQHAKLEAERSEGADPEDQDEYRALNIFWVPPTGDTSFGGEWRYTHHHLGARRRTMSDRRSATCYSRSHSQL